jgi:hypothetical protein
VVVSDSHRVLITVNTVNTETAKAKAFDAETAEAAPRGSENYGNCFYFLNDATAVLFK